MSSKDTQQAIKRLRKEGLVTAVESTGGQHLKLILADGSFYIAACSSASSRGVKNMITGIRRQCRK
jgi:hypothetical protein